ncbi:hypothetical protein A0H81_09230 [Grifola frondosa]|uniref:Uncharacterized protein n=1 Tax=Grifola frondosa TaxID=5627 RepID=A0A1C7M2B6_GRIFR|nr:hypothetical protein A0H81_09230 [Grifola frondosa]
MSAPAPPLPHTASIRTPSFSSYAPHRSSKHTLPTPPVYVSVPHASVPLVTLAVRGDGVHVLDLETLHTAISHPLASAAFSCPAATRTTHANGIQMYHVRRHGLSRGSQSRRAREVRLERSKLSGGVVSVKSQQKKTTALISHPVSYIYTPEDFSERVILVGPNDITVTDAQLKELGKASLQIPDGPVVPFLKHFVFPRKSCTFVPSQEAIPEEGIVSVAFMGDKDVARVLAHVIDREGSIQSVGVSPIPLKQTDIIDISCSASGFFSVLTPSGHWYSFQLSSPKPSTLSLRTPSEPLRLKNLTFTATGRAHEAALASLGSSHVLLAGVASTELVLLLWDLQYGVLLASHTVPLPAPLSTEPHAPPLALIASSAHALLVLPPAAELERPTAAGRTSILAVPFSVPPRATLAAALGRAEAGAKWLASRPGKYGHTDMSAAAWKALKNMRNAGAGADVAHIFFEYLKDAKSGEEDEKPALEHAFVNEVLALVLGGEGTAYSPKVVRYLLERRVVSSGMVEGGVLPVLAARQDWESVMLSLQMVAPEERTNRRERDAGRRRRSRASVAARLPRALRVLPHDPAMLRIALRRRLPDAADLVCVLEVLDGWLARLCTADVRLLPEGVAKDAHGVLVPVYPPASDPAGVPPPEKVLAFLQSVLDASFLALLAHAPAHALLRTLPTRLEPALVHAGEMELLRGTLQPFARAHAKAVVDGAQGAPKTDTRVDWRRRKKSAHEQAGMAVGLYQVEELVL